MSYNLQYDQGENQYISVIGEAPDNLERVITRGGLTTDVIFKFKYRVRSKYGWSDDFSPVLSARTATIPEQVSGITFSIIDSLNVRFGWDQPYNGGSPVTSYTILFMHHDQVSFSPVLTYCDGSQSSIVLQRYCDIPLQTLRASPLNLIFNDLVVAKVYATNKIGSGLESDLNTDGVTVQTEPITPTQSPSVIYYDEYSV